MVTIAALFVARQSLSKRTYILLPYCAMCAIYEWFLYIISSPMLSGVLSQFLVYAEITTLVILLVFMLYLQKYLTTTIRIFHWLCCGIAVARSLRIILIKCSDLTFSQASLVNDSLFVLIKCVNISALGLFVIIDALVFLSLLFIFRRNRVTTTGDGSVS